MKARPVEERFWEKVDRSGGNDACWEWSAARFPTGYGHIAIKKDGKRMSGYAHRVAYELTHGPIPKGMHVCHTCDNPPCANPSHLWLGTALDNMHDRDRKGRGAVNMACGERAGNAKLTWQIVREIRRLHALGCNGLELSRQFDTSPSNVYSILNNKSWKE